MSMWRLLPYPEHECMHSCSMVFGFLNKKNQLKSSARPGPVLFLCLRFSTFCATNMNASDIHHLCLNMIA